MSGPASQTCRICGGRALHTLVDLGSSPLSNAYLTLEDLDRPEVFYPLHPKVCAECFLVQLPEFVPPDQIFSDYAYFSSYSDSWSRHAAAYAAAMIDRFHLDSTRLVVEVASNDGYLLKHFKQRDVPVLGVEPASNVAAVAQQAGVPTVTEFFGRALAEQLVSEGRRADLLVGNNVLAHVPDLHDFVAGLQATLAPAGVLTMEFPHLLRLLQRNQFDTIYHEHFSYLSLTTVNRLFGEHGLHVFDVEELHTHGGSLRIFVAHHGTRPSTHEVERVLEDEDAHGLRELETYRSFGVRVHETKRRFLEFLIDERDRGHRVAGYGAPAKANTLLNYCGVRSDLLQFTVDRNPHKQGRFLPGTHIPVFAPNRITDARPDWIVILPWNLREEIAAALAATRVWGARMVVPIPTLEVVE